MQEDDFAHLGESVKAGDTQPFLDLVGPHLPVLSRVSRAMLHNRADAEEVVQETLLKALTHLDQLRDAQCVKGWLLQIAVNEARMRMRVTRRFQSGSENEESADVTEESESVGVLQRLKDKQELPSQIVERKELWAAARRSLLAIDPIYREVFVLRDMQGLPVPHTAMILGISEAAVNTRLHRARLQMRKLMAPLFRRPRAIWKPFGMFVEMGKRYKYKVVPCQTLLDEMSDYLDGSVSDQVRTEIETHLNYCSRCMLLFDTTRKVLQLVADERVFTQPFDCKVQWDRILTVFPEKDK